MKSSEAAANIVNSIELPRIPNYEIRLTASPGDDIRKKIIQAIEDCSQRGGGRIVLPPGSFRCNGPIHLKSHIELHLSEGTFLKFSPEPDLYLPPVPTRWEGVEIINYSPMIYGNGLTDVAITGKGVLAGGSEIRQLWKDLQKETQERTRCLEEQHIPPEKRIFGRGDLLRQAMLQFINSERILLEDLTLTDNAFWMVHPVYCKNITVRRLKFDCMLENNDGIDLDSCENILVEDSVFRNGDDAVVIKSGRDQDGLRVGRPTRRAVIRNCTFAEVIHGFAIGSELSGGAEDIYVHDINMITVFYEAISFKSTRGRGGVIRNIQVESIKVESAGRHLICIDNDYSNTHHGDALTLFQDITIRNVFCGKAKNAFRLQGKAEIPLKNIRIENVTAEHADSLYSLDEYSDDVHFINVKVNGLDIQRKPQ
ncbi:MAG: glycoside hydrolase family 28 protein [Lentisphaeria bacterium]|nr:glycoside hydrolase family 28 protein [Lentisphaeria bacterium]